jgi:uncharacterized membrane protein
MPHDQPALIPQRATRPFYPMLLAFAASCFVGLLATDLAYWWTADVMWSDFSSWLVTVGVVVGWGAIVIALIEGIARRRVQARPTWAFVVGNIVILILATLNMLMHTRDAWGSVMPWGLALSAAIVLVLLVTRWATREGYFVARAEAMT